MHAARVARHGDPGPVEPSPRAYIRGATPSERFWAHVRKTPTCWEWTAGTTGASGYGVFRANGKATTAHRWAYEQLVGAVPEGLDLDHLCRNRLCVNPAHLEPVTHRENCLRGEAPAARYAQRERCDRCGSAFRTTVVHRGKRGGTAYRPGTVLTVRYCPECNRRWTGRSSPPS